MPRLGFKQTAEHREKNRARQIGKKRPIHSIMMKGNRFHLGMHDSEQTRQKKSTAHRGSSNSNWKGGRSFDGHGYIRIKIPNHPYANNHGYVREHRLLMEGHLGRTLLPHKIVHHINGIKSDNRIENLMLFSSLGEHVSKAHKKRRIK